jgi:spore germination protein YaaH
MPTATPTPRVYQVSIWAPYISFLEQKTLTDNADTLSEVNFFWYELGADGEIQGGVQSKAGLKAAREAGLRALPSILNGGFDRERVAAIIHDGDKRAAHIDAIVQLVVENGYDGIDIDYESLYEEDRDAFTAFIEELAAALHQEGKLLSTTVHPKTGEGGTWGGPKAHDWAKLGAVSDEFKIMIYDMHHGASKAGPIAPLDWADAVLTYAETQVEPGKIFMGVPFYGYDWVGSTGESIEWRQAVKRAKMYNAEVQRDASSGEAWYTYDDGRHTVYFNDAETLAGRLDMMLTQHPDIAGVSIWRLGGEDPANWAVLQEKVVGR